MSANSVEQLNTQETGLNLYKTYNYLEKTSSEAVSEAISEFWEMESNLKLISISENENFFFQGSEYFVTRIKLSKKDQFVVRLSKEAVQFLLDSSLGCNPSFDFDKLTELEAKILTSFNNLIYTNFSNNMYTKEETGFLEKDGKTIPGECNFTFFIKEQKNSPAKIVITLPSKYIKTEEVYAAENMFGLEAFPNAKAEVDIFLGSTTLLLNDIKNIEKEDIIVLEHSNINKMTLNFQGNQLGFGVSPEPSLIISFDNNNEDKDMSNTNNIWDNIQVDVSAEFEKVKISLGEIKQISEGLVLDMGSLYENKVYLKVENKIIAEGELVIINDQYGVKINKILNDKDTVMVEDNTPSEKTEQEEIIKEEPAEQNIEEEIKDENSDEFDYKDFDVDDENI